MCKQDYSYTAGWVLGLGTLTRRGSLPLSVSVGTLSCHFNDSSVNANSNVQIFDSIQLIYNTCSYEQLNCQTNPQHPNLVEYNELQDRNLSLDPSRLLHMLPS